MQRFHSMNCQLIDKNHIMKKIILYFTIILFSIILIQSCKKESTPLQKDQTINVIIKANEDYSYDLGYFGYEEGARIIQQARHYETSSLMRELNTGKITYKYKPSLNYTGTDEVKINSERGSDGASPNNNITPTTIEFTITN